MIQTFVYCLVNPISQTIFYVGQTSRGRKEPEQYIELAGKGSTIRPVKRHLRRLHKMGFRATWEILEECVLEDLDRVESFWISNVLSCGGSLCNVTPGGAGKSNRGYRWSEEQRSRHRAKLKQVFNRPEIRRAREEYANRPEIKDKNRETQRRIQAIAQARPEVRLKKHFSMLGKNRKVT